MKFFDLIDKNKLDKNVNLFNLGKQIFECNK